MRLLIAMRCRAALLGTLVSFVFSAAGVAQIGGNGSQGQLHPTVDITLDTTHGVFQFTSITIPAGVTVTLTGPNPAILLSQGDRKSPRGISRQGNGHCSRC